MQDGSTKNIIRTITAICFCIFVLLMSAVNVRLAARPALSWLSGDVSFREMTQEIAENYVSARLWQRSGFINFNGLFARLSQRHAYNQTLLMKNGMLNYGSDTFSEEPDETLVINLANAVGELSDYLQPMDIPMFFVLAPVKEDLKGELLPEAFHNYQNQTGDLLLSRLFDQDINILDLRTSLTDTAEHSGRYFYRTDHHWNGDGALHGFGMIMDWLQDEYDAQLDTSYTDPECWKRFTLEDSFLGTHGKRVGRFYAGTDDLIWYEPLFDTHMSLSIPDFTEFYRGSFSEVNIRDKFREKQDLFAVTPYVIYVGGDYPSVQHRNVHALNQKKVLLLKDSFGLAVEAFLSTEFSAVDVIDPRYFTEARIAEYCEWERPDLVIMMMSPSAVSNRYYTRVGISEEERVEIERKREHRMLSDYDVSADGQNLPEMLTALPVRLENGKTYRIEFKQIAAQNEMPETICAILYNKTLEAVSQQRIFDTEYYGEYEPWRWTFNIPENNEDEEFVLYVCAGLFNSESDDSAEICSVTVTELS